MGAAKAATKLAKWVDRRSPKTVRLAPDRPGMEIARDARWRVIVNVEVESDDAGSSETSSLRGVGTQLGLRTPKWSRSLIAMMLAEARKSDF